MSELLNVQNLSVNFFTRYGIVHAIEGIEFILKKGKILGLVGESGCGKSVTALSVIGLIQAPQGRIVSGTIVFDGTDLTAMDEKKIRKIRGKDISMIFQEPMTSLNPVFKIGDQIGEIYKLHYKMNKKEAKDRTIEMLRLVGIGSPEHRVNDYPHSLSGGMKQRVMIAMALAGSPKLIIADEPTTALDVTMQVQILDLLLMLKENRDMSILLITHDLGIVRNVVDWLCVMYAGRIVEYGNVDKVFANPLHPYTKGLYDSIPLKDSHKTKFPRLRTIGGNVPGPFEMPEGCRFLPRCSYHTDMCIQEPMMIKVEDERLVRCWLFS